MEPSGRNQWEPVANGTRSKTAQTPSRQSREPPIIRSVRLAAPEVLELRASGGVIRQTSQATSLANCALLDVEVAPSPIAPICEPTPIRGVAPLLAEPLGAKPPCDLPGLARVPDRRLQRERQARARLDAALPKPAARPRRGSRKDTSSQS